MCECVCVCVHFLAEACREDLSALLNCCNLIINHLKLSKIFPCLSHSPPSDSLSLPAVFISGTTGTTSHHPQHSTQSSPMLRPISETHFPLTSPSQNSITEFKAALFTLFSPSFYTGLLTLTASAASYSILPHVR